MPEFTGIVSQEPVVRVRLTPTYPGAQHIFGLGVVDTGAAMTCVDTDAALEWHFRQLGYCRMHSTSESNALTPLFDAELEIVGRQGSHREFLHAPGFMGDGAPTVLHDTSKIIALIGRDILNKGVLVYDGPKNNFRLRLP